MSTSIILVLIAGVLPVIIGMIWYHPKVFGTAWARMSNISPEVADSTKRKMPLYAIIAFLASMLVAWVMSFVGMALGEYVDWVSAVELGIWIWLGFVAPTMLGMVLWEHKPFSLYLINASYWLVSLIAMALVLVLGSTLFGGTPLTY
jgi:hypothetical protein